MDSVQSHFSFPAFSWFICNLIFLLMLGAPLAAADLTYISVKDGDFSDCSTWTVKGSGMASLCENPSYEPPSDNLMANLEIRHHLTLKSREFTMTNDTIYITDNGIFDLRAVDSIVYLNEYITMTDAAIQVDNGGSIVFNSYKHLNSNSGSGIYIGDHGIVGISKGMVIESEGMNLIVDGGFLNCKGSIYIRGYMPLMILNGGTFETNRMNLGRRTYIDGAGSVLRISHDFTGDGYMFITNGGQMHIDGWMETDVMEKWNIDGEGSLLHVGARLLNGGFFGRDVKPVKASNGGKIEFVDQAFLNGRTYLVADSGGLISIENSRYLIGEMTLVASNRGKIEIKDKDGIATIGGAHTALTLKATHGGTITFDSLTHFIYRSKIIAEDSGSMQFKNIFVEGSMNADVKSGGLLKTSGDLTLGSDKIADSESIPDNIADWPAERTINLEDGNLYVSGDLNINSESKVKVGRKDAIGGIGAAYVKGMMNIDTLGQCIVDGRLVVLGDASAPIIYEETIAERRWPYVFKSSYEEYASVTNPPLVQFGGTGCEYWQGPFGEDICRMTQAANVGFGAMASTLDCGEVLLTWTTTYEIDNDQFIIEKSADGLNYERVGTVSSEGNSFWEKQYMWAGEVSQDGSTVYYRILFKNRRRRSWTRAVRGSGNPKLEQTHCFLPQSQQKKGNVY